MEIFLGILRSRANAKPIVLLPAALLILVFLGGGAAAQGGRPLVDNYSIKLGAIYSEAFVNVKRNSDGAEANLVADSDVSPFVSFATPPFFLGDSSLAFGIALSYSEFTSSQQQFSGTGRPESIGSRVDVEMTIIAPALSYYFGKNSTTQFLRLFVVRDLDSPTCPERLSSATPPARSPRRT